MRASRAEDPLSLKAGFAKIDISPQESMLLAGYGGNERFFETRSQPIFARAVVLKNDVGLAHVIVAVDLCGLSEATIARIENHVLLRYDLPPERLIINCSHNHSAPNTLDVLELYYEHSPALDQQISDYTDFVESSIEAGIGQAMAGTFPVRLSFAQGLCGFGVNRRRHLSGQKHLPGVVDHDVPVLKIERENGHLVGIIFSYACHTTSLCGKDLNGDYAGWACSELENTYEGCTALFLMGCGGDINPMPRYEMALSKACGTLLAGAVRHVLDSSMPEIPGPQYAAKEDLHLPIAASPHLHDLKNRMEKSSDKYQRKFLSVQIENRLSGRKAPDTVPFRVRCWNFGAGLTLITLSGEVVADYSLNLKERYGWENTWVIGYCEHLTPYIPSERVLREGGYEGTEAMMEYGYDAPFKSGLEKQILDAASRCQPQI